MHDKIAEGKCPKDKWATAPVYEAPELYVYSITLKSCVDPDLSKSGLVVAESITAAEAKAFTINGGPDAKYILVELNNLGPLRIDQGCKSRVTDVAEEAIARRFIAKNCRLAFSLVKAEVQKEFDSVPATPVKIDDQGNIVKEEQPDENVEEDLGGSVVVSKALR